MIRYIFAMVFLLVTPLQAQDLGGMIGDMEQQPDLVQPQPEQPPNPPQTGEEEPDEKFDEEWLEKELSQEGNWFIQTHKEDKYGRILGVLYRAEDVQSLNDKMIMEGYADKYLP